jgi:hypothetical protein
MRAVTITVAIFLAGVLGADARNGSSPANGMSRPNLPATPCCAGQQNSTGVPVRQTSPTVAPGTPVNARERKHVSNVKWSPGKAAVKDSK